MKSSQNSKFQVKIRNSKFTSMHTLILSSNLYSVISCLTFSYSVPMHVMRKYNAKLQRICIFFLNSIGSKVANFEYFLVARFHITLKKFLGDWTTGYVLKKILEIFKCIRKNQWIHFIQEKKTFTNYFMNNLLALFLCEINVLNIFYMVDFYRFSSNLYSKFSHFR